VAGRVKTRLIGDLTAQQAADLHGAFLADLVERLGALRGVEIELAWALAPGEALPAGPLPGVEQRGEDLGERLFTALAAAAREASAVAALGSDHPALPLARVEEAFARVEAGAPVVLGPAEDGGYYLIALRAEAVQRRLFADIAWSTSQVLSQTLERCRELGMVPELLTLDADVDTPEDLRRLAGHLVHDDLGCPRTRGLLASWGRL
jgi:rSAM/selenodomain-associated transferase 1